MVVKAYPCKCEMWGRVKLISSLAGPACMSQKIPHHPILSEFPHMFQFFSPIIKNVKVWHLGSSPIGFSKENWSLCYTIQGKHPFGVCCIQCFASFFRSTCYWEDHFLLYFNSQRWLCTILNAMFKCLIDTVSPRLAPCLE